MFENNGQTYCDCGACISGDSTRCDLCIESYALDDEYQAHHQRYSRQGIHIKGKIPVNFPIRLRDSESWNTPDNAR